MDTGCSRIGRLLNGMAQTTTITAAIACLLLGALPAQGAETAVLRNGYNVRVERHEAVGDHTRLYLDASGKSFADVRTTEIIRYEAAPELPVAQTASDSEAAASDPPTFDLGRALLNASRKYNLDPDLLRCVIHAESNFNPRAISPKGARGLMQLMPATARRLGIGDSFDPTQNIEAGAQHLSDLLDRYHNDLVTALAAYNAGTDPVEHYRGVPPFRETRAYVARIIREFNRLKGATKLAAHRTPEASAQSIFVSDSTADNLSGQ